MSPPFLISKSKYLNGLQCLKFLWHEYNAQDEIPEPDAATQAIFDQGHAVGEIAKHLFPEGIEIKGAHNEIDVQLRDTEEKLPLRKPLFEAARSFGGAFARADILVPVGDDHWDILEVKSAAHVKEVNIHDVSLQYYVFHGSGLKINSVFILTVNTAYLRNGAIDPNLFFLRYDATEEAKALLASIPKNLDVMVEVIGLKESPNVPIGPQCSGPYDCPLIEKCWSYLPEHHVLTLPWQTRKKGFDLINQGVTAIRSLPATYKLTPRQMIQRQSIIDGKPYLDKGKIDSFLRKLQYPLHFLDFETVMPAIPLYDGTHPFQQVPFQFSLHVVDSLSSDPVHYTFLAEGQQDPRPQIIKALKPLIRPKGSIISYNVSFERTRLRELREYEAKDSEWYETVDSRLIDLYSPFRSYHYYHPSQRGSTCMSSKSNGQIRSFTKRRFEPLVVIDCAAFEPSTSAA